MRFSLSNRSEAGKLLALRLTSYHKNPNVIVLGLPRGGVPVAYQVAKSLGVPLDICLVRKLGVPQREELAMGAIATGDVQILNQEIIDSLEITPEIINEVVEKETQELKRREQAYRGDRPLPSLENRIVILVDDGIATGSTMLAAIQAVKQQNPQKIVVAVPVALGEVCSILKPYVDQIVCLIRPRVLHSISSWYQDFKQVRDYEVCYLLSQDTVEGEIEK